MKALIISSLLFFSLRAMSSEVGEEKKSDCAFANQSNKREAKVVDAPVKQAAKKEALGVSK